MTCQKCEVSVCSSSVLALWVHMEAMHELLMMRFYYFCNRDLACRVQAAQTLEDGEGPSGQKGCQSQPPALHRPAGKRHEGGGGDQCGRGRAPAGKTRSLPVVTLKWNKTYKTLELLCIPDF